MPEVSEDVWQLTEKTQVETVEKLFSSFDYQKEPVTTSLSSATDYHRSGIEVCQLQPLFPLKC